MKFTRNGRRFRIILSGSVILLILLPLLYYYRTTDPEQAFAPQCMFRVLTGWSCPGCGSQRFMHALLNGNFADAWHFNYFLPFGIIMALVCLWLEWTRKSHSRRYRYMMRPLFIQLFIAVVIIWTIIRNILNI